MSSPDPYGPGAPHSPGTGAGAGAPQGPYAPQTPYAPQAPYAPFAPYAPYAPQAPYASQAHAYPLAPPLYRQNLFVPPGATTRPLLSPTLRKLKLAAGIAQLATLFAGIAALVAGAVLGPDDGGALLALGGALFAFWYLILLTHSIIVAVWTYKIWSWIPPEQRHTKLWKKYISPGTAVGFMFIPYFNLYWMFVIYLGIPEILDRMRVAYPTEKESAKNLGLFLLIGSLFMPPAGPFLHYVFDKRVEGIAADMQARMQHGLATGFG